MSSGLSYKDLSEWVYFLDGKHKQHFYMEVGDVRKFGGVQYKILKIEDDTSNGVQAMAVAPFINGKVDTSEIIIAYAGTNPGDGLDNWTDIQTVIGGSKELDTSKLFETATPIDGQVITAEKFAEDVKKDYPNAVMTTTNTCLTVFLVLILLI